MQKLNELQAHVGIMQSRCDDAETQLQLTNEASKALLERAGSLRRSRWASLSHFDVQWLSCPHRQEVEARKSIVTLFLARFTLSDEEMEAMTSRDVPIGARFFKAMDKTEKIRSDCRVLMSGEDGPTKAGSVRPRSTTQGGIDPGYIHSLDIMASTSSHLEQGYEKILRWCSFEFRQIGRDLQIEVSPTMREAVRRLRLRPELLTCVICIHPS